MKSVLVAIVTVLAVATAVQAQINSPPPTLRGQPSFHLWSVPGVISGGGLATFFPCRNTTGAPIRVGIEVFGDPGGAAVNDPSATSLDIPPGGNVRFATGGAVGFGFSGNLVVGPVNSGSARIVATAKSGIICSVPREGQAEVLSYQGRGAGLR